MSNEKKSAHKKRASLEEMKDSYHYEAKRSISWCEK